MQPIRKYNQAVYFSGSKVDWDERERPIIKSHDKLKWARKKPPSMPSTAAAPR